MFKFYANFETDIGRGGCQCPASLADGGASAKCAVGRKVGSLTLRTAIIRLAAATASEERTPDFRGFQAVVAITRQQSQGSQCRFTPELPQYFMHSRSDECLRCGGSGGKRLDQFDATGDYSVVAHDQAPLDAGGQISRLDKADPCMAA